MKPELSEREGGPTSIGRGATRAAPLWAVLVFSWVSSLGTGLVANGVYFLTKTGYHFSDAENYALALTGGLAYIGGAMGAGPLLRWLRVRGINARGALVGVLVALGALCFVPLAAWAAWTPDPSDAQAAPPHWPMWVLLGLYQPLTGILWPIIEAYLSGGRSGTELRSALGVWNLTWSSALVVALWAMGPVTQHPQLVLAALGVLHLLSIASAWPMGPEPGEHLHEEHAPPPPVYDQLLVTFRILLPTSYIVLTALTPYLPTLLTRLGVPTNWQPPLGATWTAGRVVTFLLLERWHGWHGRWWPAVAAVVLLLGGFGAAVLSPHAGGGAGVPVFIAGLAAFGVGMAAIYTASLYYAMECEREDVEAGSRHEALIGVGYSGGPACGLVAGFAVQVGLAAAGTEDVVMLGMVAVIAVGLASGAGVRSVWVRRKEP